MNFMGDIFAHLPIFGRNITCQDKQLYSTKTFSANSLAHPANPRGQFLVTASPVSLIYPIGSSLDESVFVMFPLSLPGVRIAPVQCPGHIGSGAKGEISINSVFSEVSQVIETVSHTRID